jgi:hypothetical protein
MDEAQYLQDFQIDIEEAEIWRWMGSHGRKGDPRLQDEVRQAKELAVRLIEPQAVYMRLPVRSIEPAGISLENGERLNGAAGPHLARDCEGADELVVNVATIGPKLETRVQELFAEKQQLKAVILDAAGSAASSASSRYVIGCIYQQTAERGLKAGHIQRPGSHYWDLMGQRVLFAMMPAEHIGVKLTPSCLIIPKKSSSGFIPIGKNLVHEHKASGDACRRCPNLKCIARIEDNFPAATTAQAT